MVVEKRTKFSSKVIVTCSTGTCNIPGVYDAKLSSHKLNPFVSCCFFPYTTNISAGRQGKRTWPILNPNYQVLSSLLINNQFNVLPVIMVLALNVFFFVPKIGIIPQHDTYEKQPCFHFYRKVPLCQRTCLQYVLDRHEFIYCHARHHCW